MKMVNSKLVICGDGNFMPQLKELIKTHQVEDKVELRGMLLPGELWSISQQAYIGMAVAENQGMNQYLALPNKFFDYVHAGLPQLSMNYPEYRQLNKQYEVAVLIEDLAPKNCRSYKQFAGRYCYVPKAAAKLPQGPPGMELAKRRKKINRLLSICF